jgi:general stress protein 26
MVHKSATRRYKNFQGDGSLNTLPLDTWQDSPTAHSVKQARYVDTTPTP